jgi:5-(carboxyamino)imidazole ribonucleotide synthase
MSETVAVDSSAIRRIGIIGGGQLAWMMAPAAQTLGLDLVIQTPSPTDPAVSLATESILAAVDDVSATAMLASCCDVITFENEFVDLGGLAQLAAAGACFRPSLTTLAPLLDKYQQRSCLRDLGLPVPAFVALEAFHPTAEQPWMHSFPRVLKTRRHGYDGQGTFIAKDQRQWDLLLARLADRPLLVEEFVPFERELAVIAARSVEGAVVTYPVVETYQVNQVCRWVVAPATVSPTVTMQAEAIAQRLLTHLDAVGVFGIELFLTADHQLLVNEVAPRVHNSGHFTLDACQTSQFEQHLRAVAGLPLGSPAMSASAALMVNLLGYEQSHHDYQEKRNQLADLPNVHVHWYGKTESRPGRKLGHVTVLLEGEAAQPPAAIALAQEIERIWYGSAGETP